ncbi:DUF6506 family protein [Phytoactinopolyspora halotolerans]|uniref:Uncharacterized protein n=1 Tax=Phytoactinopolyspora halotolerans TaxID=1981512 RepID=A0A6L9SKJ8_9ACTN|nr:DUF6506 family protein [Phytoactinopolyspora halotolerans]NEE04620.1 hypothetical protein [Phytoactinopolyspora halotolerans]
MTVTWAYIYEHPGTDPVTDRTVIDRGGQRTILAPTPTAAAAPEIARRLVDEDGVSLIELCGGFSLADAARVHEAVENVAVGHVTFAVDSVAAAAAYGATFDEAVTS